MDSQNKTYQTFTVKPKQLSAFVNWYTVYHFTEENPVMLHPEGYFELVFQLGNDFMQSTGQIGEWELRPLQFVGGLHNKSYLIKPQKKASSLISVNFKPNAARYFIPDKLHLYKNKLVGLEDVFSRSNLGRIEEIHSHSQVDKSIDLIESFLIAIFRERPGSRIDLALEAIVRKNGFVSIEDIASLSCLSNSQFRKRFNEEVGMSPKEYSKIVRIKHISHLLRQNPNTNLTGLTYKLGYFDQSHFIRDFKSVTGIPPKSFLAG